MPVEHLQLTNLHNLPASVIFKVKILMFYALVINSF